MDKLLSGETRSKYNESKLPLEDIFLIVEENGSCERVPALAARFSTNRCMTLYLPPPKKEKGKDFIMGMKEDWLQRANMCIEDFEWLLGLSHHRFWSQFVFQRRSCDGLVSFLQEAYPFYALDQLPDDGEVKSVYNRIVALAFSLLVRLTMRIESPTEWIGEKKYASIIYNKFLISIPMLLDICVIYGLTNEAEIRRMTEQVFTVQPCYRDDLVKCIEDVKNVYYQSVNKVAGSCGHLVDFVKGNVKNESINITLPEVDDVLFFLMDVTISLSTFADMYTDAATIMHQQHLEAVIVSTYQKIIDGILYQTKIHFRDKLASVHQIEGKLNILRYYLLKLFRQCVNSTLTSLVEKREELTSQAISTFADGYMTVMLETLSEKEFMKDYNIVFPLCADIELLNQVCPEVETDHLLNSVMSFYEDFEKWTKSEAPDNCAAGGQEPLPSTSSNERKVVTGVELESLITEVKDILPHLGEGFIQKCLEHFNYSSSALINAVLENILPDSVLTLDPDLPYVPEERSLPERVNVFDNDEFDIMSRDYIDPDKVHKGKRKDKYTDLKDLIDDKSHREDLRDVYTKLGNVEELGNEYDDEYDDTYDGLDVTVEEDEDPERRPFVVPRVLRQNNEMNNDEVEEDNNEPSDQEEQSQKSKLFNFVENPELVRSRFEAMRIRKSQNRGNPPPRSKEKDVVGKAKGQGQEKDVLINRQRKGANKSSQANHSRKRMAQNKQRQGMLHL